MAPMVYKPTTRQTFLSLPPLFSFPLLPSPSIGSRHEASILSYLTTYRKVPTRLLLPLIVAGMICFVYGVQPFIFIQLFYKIEKG